MFRRRPVGIEAQFGALELRVMESLWERDAFATVRELGDAFPSAAYTTLMTTVDRLYRKGLLDRRKQGRAFLYKPRYSREQLESGVAANALQALLRSGGAEPVLSYFVEEVSRRDERLLDELERLVREKRRERDRKEPGR